MTVTFCGHREIHDNFDVEKWLYSVTEDLIRSGADTFYLGGYGEFDWLARDILAVHKVKHSHIKLILVTPYINHNMNDCDYDDVIFPNLDNVHNKIAIIKRNEWMVKQSDCLVAYVIYNKGGASRTLNYAKQNNKQTIEYQYS